MFDPASHIVAVPDFPKPGILFRDIMPLLREHFVETVDALEARLDDDEWAKIDVVAGIESRGFILASALADRRRKGFAPVRKAGKLPPPVVSRTYELEYGSDALEMQAGRGRVLIVDDVLATGGTLRAAAALCGDAGYEVVQLLVLVDLHLAPRIDWGNSTVRHVVQYG